MASCEEFELLLSRSLDETLSPEENAHLQLHLELCAPCRALGEELSFLHNSLPQLSVEPPEDLHAQLLRALAAEPKLRALPSVTRRKHMLRNFAATAAALVVLVSALTFQDSQKDTPSEGSPLLAHEAPTAPNDAQKINPAPEADGPPIEAMQPTAEPAAPPADVQPNTQARIPDKRSVESSPPPEEIRPNADQNDSEPVPPNSAGQALVTAPTPNAVELPSPKETLLNQADAHAALKAYLTSSGQNSAQIQFLQPTEDALGFLFTVRIGNGPTLDYSVSATDGSVLCLSSAHSSTPPASTEAGAPNTE